MKIIRILVTGGAGYVGSYLLPKLLESYKVRVIDNITYGYYSILPHLGNPNFEFINGDIRDNYVLQRSLEDVDVVIHLAAIVGYPACKAQPKIAYETNYIATKNLVEMCQVPIIFASTGSNYGSVDEICTEETLLNPLTEYGKSKVKAEGAVKLAKNFVIYRFSTGFGLSLRPRLDLLINNFLFSAMKDKELIIFEKDYWRSFIHVKDMANSFIFAIKNFDKMNREIYNVGSEELCMTKEHVALKIKEHVDYYLKFAEFGTDPDKRNYRVSFKKINALGFKTKYGIDYGISEMIKAFQFIDNKECYYNNKVFR